MLDNTVNSNLYGYQSVEFRSKSYGVYKLHEKGTMLETMASRQLPKIQNRTNSENGHLVFSIFEKKQENNGVGDISSLFLFYVVSHANQVKRIEGLRGPIKCYKNKDNCLLALSPEFNSVILRFMSSASSISN